MIDSLSPEQKKAIRVFEEALQDWRNLLSYSINERILVTNERVFTYSPISISTLPRENNWLWNKSRPKHSVTVQNVEVTFFKANTRKVRQNTFETIPKHKLWIFQTFDPESFVPLYFVWCERGKSRDASPPRQEPVSPEPQINTVPVSLRELSFLSPYVTPTTAILFGWK